MPTKNQKNKVFFKRLFWFVFVFVFVFSALAVPMKQARAQMVTTSPIDTMANIGKRTVEFLKTWYKDIKKGIVGIATTKFLMQAVDKFAQNMAQKIAVGMATGAKGGKPLAFTKEMGAYLKDSADAAAGDYIENLSKDWVNNLCKPDLSLRLKYGLSLYKIEQPDKDKDKPKCTFSEMVNNWDEAVNDPDLLKNFSVSFEPEQNDIGIWLQLTGDVEREKERAKAVAEKKRGNDAVGGIAPKTDEISGDVTTPAGKISKVSEVEVGAAIEAEKQKTAAAATQVENLGIGSILKKFFTTFGKTLADEVVKNYLAGTYSAQDAKDKWGDFCEKNPELCGKDDSLSNPNAQDTSGGKQQAEAKYSGYIKTNLSESGNYDVLSELASCDDSKKIPGPTTCVIDSNFVSAIQDKLTVSEAIEKGLLDGNKSVGYKSDGKEMTYLEGYPYRSLVILRKYRIIPVGWELAAEYFVTYGGGSDAPTLNGLIDVYDDTSSPYYHLVDPNWVLKLPSGYCKVRGAGPEIIMEQINPGSDADNNGDFEGENDLLPSKTIIRNDQYCADEQSCIKEDIDGNCKYYGYCMEEKRLWKFDGEPCDEINNTCQGFVGPEGEVASYLKNSLDWDDCSKDNSGCQWYCDQFNPKENSLTSDGAVAYWSMDELTGGGAKVEDEAGSNDGSLKGDAHLVIGKLGKALSFDGTGDYMEVADNNNLDIQDGFSIELWLKTTVSGKRIIDKYKTKDGYLCEVTLAGALTCWLLDNDSAIISVSATSVIDGKWHHAAWIVDGTNKQYLYIDGVLEDTDSLGDRGNVSNNLAFYVGINDGIMNEFNGQIDELSVYSRALSGSEIWNNYISSNSYNCLANGDEIYLSDSAAVCEAEDAGCNEYLVSENGLVGYWKFDKGEGATVYDSSGYENEGTLGNDTAWVIGKSGQALSFDGADDNVQMNNSLGLGDNSFTFSHWVKTAQPATVQVYTMGNASSGDGYRFGIWNGKIGFLIGNDSLGMGGYSEGICGVTPVNDGNWHFITGVFDRGNAFECYVDGVKDNSIPLPSSYIGMSDIAPRIGAPPCCADFDGLIDEVSVYNRALSEQEVSALYRNSINFSDIYVKVANKNLHCFGRTAGDAVFDLPPYVDNCISLGSRYDSYGYDTCFEFSSYKNETDCAANNGVWSSLAIKIPRHTVQTYCEKNDGVWSGDLCVTGGGACVGGVCNAGAEVGKSCIICQTQCLKLDDAACANYAFSCKSSELGCEKYTPTNGGSYVPGVISDDDLCPAECAGYDTYKQESTNFETSKFLDFIPKTAKSCASNNAGCDEFTNLEAAGSHGESLEYWTYLRQCEKVPTASAGYQCGDFYTWVGSDATGYQLQSYYLKSTGIGSAEEPMEILRVEEYLGECNDGNDALTNKNCKEFYNSAGEISYHLLKKTITCSDDCINYRKTAPAEFDLKQVCKNIGGTWNIFGSRCDITSEEACKAVSGVWSGTCNPVNTADEEACKTIGGVWSGTCNPANIADSVFCANANYLDAMWDAVSSVCSKIDYSAIPAEGVKCQSSANGCRQYTGNVGGNVMNVFNDNFESDSYIYDFPDAGRGWLNGSLSSESTDSDQKSFKVNSSGGGTSTISKLLSAKCVLACAKEAGCDCLETATLNDGVDNDEVVCKVAIDNDSCYAADYTYNKGIYLLSFWAKGNNGNKITFNITDGINLDNFDGATITLSSQWQEFTLGPLEFDVEGWGNYGLSINGIKSSGSTPDSALGAFFDNIKLQAISDSIYAIKDSWRTPASCDQDWQGNSYLYYMLGCDEYSDTQGGLHYLKSFSNLCRVDAVGCQKLIDIHNFSEPFVKTWNVGDKSEITVPGYNFIYLAQTQDHSCMQSSAGCAELGKPIFTQDQTIVKGFDSVYKINDPDYYDISLCLEKNVGCQTFMSGSGSYYFKDPGEKICEYIQPTYQQDYGWYKKSDNYDINSEKCPTSNYQNLGIYFPSGVCIGGVENNKECLSAQDNQLEDQCISKGGSCGVAGLCSVGGESCLSKCSAGGGYCGAWAGACVATQSGCGAFIDPISDSSISLVTNGLFSKDLDGVLNVPDDWKNGGGLLAGFDPPDQEYVDVNSALGTFYQIRICKLDIPCAVADGCNCTLLAGESCVVPNTKSSCDIIPINIEPNTVYTLSADIKSFGMVADDALVMVECLNYVDGFSGCPSDKDKGFYLIDEAGELAASIACSINLEYRARLVIPASKLLADFNRYSMRFFSGTCNQIQLSLGSIGVGTDGISFDNIALQKTGIYYYLDGSLDEAKRECNGYVNSEKGCVLLNNRNSASLSALNFTKYLNYNADELTSTAANCVASDGSKFACNADTLMKVRPDRDCDKWLYCSNTRLGVGEDQCCVKLGVCDKMNEKGECVSNPLEYSDLDIIQNMTFDISNIDKIKNLSGYSKVGFDWIDEGGELIGGKWFAEGTVIGNLPPTQMNYIGGLVVLSNGDFELTAKECANSRALCATNGNCTAPETCDANKIRPADWDVFSSGAPCAVLADCPLRQLCIASFCAWSKDAFSLINNPVAAQNMSVSILSGDNFLKLNAGSADGINHAISNDILLLPETKYVLSGYINTQDFGPIDSSVFGAIQVLEDNIVIAEGKVAPRSNDFDRDGWLISNDGWVFVQLFFTTDSVSGKIYKIRLGDIDSSNGFCDTCSGSIYYDNISIAPVLKIQDPSITNKYPPASCRLYPKSDSKTCEYVNEDNYKYKGWYGYCLEHDPLYPEYCLNWYPVTTLDGTDNVCYDVCVYGADDGTGGLFDACVFE